MNMIKATANQRNSGGMAEVMSQALITGLEALLRNSRLADGPPAVCHAEGQLGEVGVIGCGAVKARVRPAAIVEVEVAEQVATLALR